MDQKTVILFTRFGLGDGPEPLRLDLAKKFLTLSLASGSLPAKMLFYTEGVRLACSGSPVIDILREYESKSTELVLCQTCLNYFGLDKSVEVGIVGGMGDILEALQKAERIISV